MQVPEFVKKHKVASAIVLAIAILAPTGMMLGRKNDKPSFMTAKVARGNITAIVQATGTINPLTTAPVGSYVSGNVKYIFADFNTHVEAGQVLAQIDPAMYEAQVLTAHGNLSSMRANLQNLQASLQATEASVATYQANAQKAQADLEYVKVNAKRTEDLFKQGILSHDQNDQTQSTLGQAEASLVAAKAQVNQSKAQIKQVEAQIEQARARLEGVARVTPVFRTETFSRLAGREVYLKAENLQRTGSFKIRGAYNRISRLSEPERAAGVVAASAGNHGQAVAWAAREVGARARIFMPQDAPMAKVDATRSYGAEVELAGSGLEEALDAAHAYVAATGATLVHPYEEPLVIAGQGTIAEEMLRQAPNGLEAVFVPIDGAMTMTHQEAMAVIDQIQPRLVIPMHFAFAGVADRFFELARTRWPIRAEKGGTLIVRRDSLPKSTEIRFLQAGAF